jgi:hypothetical protein
LRPYGSWSESLAFRKPYAWPGLSQVRIWGTDQSSDVPRAPNHGSAFVDMASPRSSRPDPRSLVEEGRCFSCAVATPLEIGAPVGPERPDAVDRSGRLPPRQRAHRLMLTTTRWHRIRLRAQSPHHRCKFASPKRSSSAQPSSPCMHATADECRLVESAANGLDCSVAGRKVTIPLRQHVSVDSLHGEHACATEGLQLERL